MDMNIWRFHQGLKLLNAESGSTPSAVNYFYNEILLTA
jgi:hypothetical protein